MKPLTAYTLGWPVLPSGPTSSGWTLPGGGKFHFYVVRERSMWSVRVQGISVPPWDSATPPHLFSLLAYKYANTETNERIKMTHLLVRVMFGFPNLPSKMLVSLWRGCFTDCRKLAITREGQAESCVGKGMRFRGGSNCIQPRDQSGSLHWRISDLWSKKF